jgi:hypothetical protein
MMGKQLVGKLMLLMAGAIPLLLVPFPRVGPVFN